MTRIDRDKYKDQLVERKQMLDEATIRLKAEFIGIDHVIDQITDAIDSWLLFPEMQDRPVIINLWGLTGTGKTSLIKRLSELIGYAEHYFRFDLGESSSRYFDIQDSFRDIYENCDGEPFIIGLDEFQLARTINEEQQEVDKASSRAIWDLLDCGKFDMIDFNYNMGAFNKVIKKLDLALAKGVEVERGLVTANQQLYFETVQTENEEDKDDTSKHKDQVCFVSDDCFNIIFNIVDDLFLSRNELREKLNELNGDETIGYLIHLYKKSLKPKTVDCTKALVFIMGNLDEVYSMTRNFNPDMSANEFYRQSTQITVTQVKDALLSRFRSEQIARLGNTHIIYPAFDEKAFFSIIRLELEKIKKKVSDLYQLRMAFDEKIEQLIYDEGVYPTQGTRPLFTTIYQIVNTRIGKVLNEIYLNGFIVDSLVFTTNELKSVKDSIALQIDFIKEDSKIHHIIVQQPLILGKLRKEKQNDEQAIVAVHESGHAILSSILMKTIPESVFSVTADSESEGFVFARPEWDYISKKELINRSAVLMGGLVAERIIFGDENITIGSSSDLNKATQLITHALYSCGMGSIRGTFGNEFMADIPSFILDNNNESINKEAKEMLAMAESLAEQTLTRQKALLIQMANYLSDKRAINKEKVKEFLQLYAIDFDLKNIVENGEQLFYRNHLKKLAEEYAQKQENKND